MVPLLAQIRNDAREVTGRQIGEQRNPTKNGSERIHQGFGDLVIW